MKFAVCQELFEDTPWEEQCRIIADCGYSGIEAAPFAIAEDVLTVSDKELEQLRTTAERYGLSIIGLHWLLAKTEGLHLTSPDPEVRRKTASYLIRLSHICRVLGGRVMVFGSPHQRSLQPGVDTKTAMNYAAEVFRSVMPHMERDNTVLCMEPLTQKETDFVNTCAEALELSSLVNSENFLLHQDVKAMLGAESDSIPELIHRHHDVCGHFHVNDSNLLGPGMGETDYRPIMKALVESGYDGWVSVEVFDYSPGAEHIARCSIEHMQNILRTL